MSRCQVKCGKKITQNDGMLIKTYGTKIWTDKKTGKRMSKHGPTYKTCLKYITRNTKGQTKDSISTLLLTQLLLADETRNLSDEKK